MKNIKRFLAIILGFTVYLAYNLFGQLLLLGAYLDKPGESLSSDPLFRWLVARVAFNSTGIVFGVITAFLLVRKRRKGI